MKEDIATNAEKLIRDRILKLVTQKLNGVGVNPNHITWFGEVLLVIAVTAKFILIFGLRIKTLFLWELILLFFIGLTDIIDGPTARNNNLVTWWGAKFDHFRDGCLAVWLGILAVFYEKLDFNLLFVVISFEAIIGIYKYLEFKETTSAYQKESGFFLKGFLNFIGEVILIIPNPKRMKKMARKYPPTHKTVILTETLEATIWGRFQYFFLASGAGLLLCSIYFKSEVIWSLGFYFINLEFLLALFNIYSIRKKWLANRQI